MKGIVKELDKGFYLEARRLGVDALTYLAQKVDPEPPEVAAVSRKIHARAGIAEDGGSYSRALSRYAYQVTGLEKELSARGIKGEDTVEKAFFSSANDTPLFPVYLASQIISGVLATSLVPLLVAAEIPVTSHVVEKITLTETADDRKLRRIGEGADLPKTTISRSEGSTRLYKYGRLLEFSYETWRTMQLDIVNLFLQRMGRQVGIDQTDDLIETLIAGDGTSGSAVTDTDAEVSGVLDYDELSRLFMAFPLGYQMRHAIVNDTYLRTILNMAEFKDPMAGFSFTRLGVLPGPMGAMWHRWTSTGSSSFSNDRILALDERNAIVLHREGDFLEEADQIIDRQMHRRSMSEWIGWQKLDNQATACLDITT